MYYPIIDWEKRSKEEGFDSIEEMLQYYVIRNGTFKGTAIDLGVHFLTLKRLRDQLNLSHFTPKDYYAWTKGYYSMEVLVEAKVKEGLGARRITNYIQGFVCYETIKLLVRKINGKLKAKNLNNSPPTQEHLA